MSPYLTIVAASRNDMHGGNILKRMRMFVNGLIAQCNRHDLPVELLIVEWNPPRERPPLNEVLPQPAKTDKLTLRYVQVPQEIHNRYKRASDIPLFQMIAKNVGIRRAKGEFVLCTNVDVLFSDELFEVLKKKDLRKDTFYRANRCDVPDGMEESWDIEKQLQWCSKNIIKTLGRDTRFRNINLDHFGLSGKAWFKKWVFDKLAIGFKMFWPPEKREYYLLDSFACGDFTLMSKEAWLDIQGYVELDLYSIHIDTLGLIGAAALGYRQFVFPRKACLYHVDHPLGWETMGPYEKMRFLVERPGIDYGLVFDTGMHALKERQRFNMNKENWGFADIPLEEVVYPKF
ncbi:MAG TPA: hypothetical protein VGD17_18045 [Chitinophagaceae bacterium]